MPKSLSCSQNRQSSARSWDRCMRPSRSQRLPFVQSSVIVAWRICVLLLMLLVIVYRRWYLEGCKHRWGADSRHTDDWERFIEREARRVSLFWRDVSCIFATTPLFDSHILAGTSHTRDKVFVQGNMATWMVSPMSHRLIHTNYLVQHSCLKLTGYCPQQWSHTSAPRP